MRKSKSSYPLILFTSIGFLFILMQSGCKGQSEKKEKPVNDKISSFQKPRSSYEDSFHIYNRSVIIYYPDSIQLMNIKAAMDSNVFDGTMHEFYYQIRNARNVIKKSWSELQLIEVKNFRYLVFHRKDSSREIIDLNAKNDVCGMYLFKNERSPQLADMTNIETALHNYFKKYD